MLDQKDIRCSDIVTHDIGGLFYNGDPMFNCETNFGRPCKRYTFSRASVPVTDARRIGACPAQETCEHCGAPLLQEDLPSECLGVVGVLVEYMNPHSPFRLCVFRRRCRSLLHGAKLSDPWTNRASNVSAHSIRLVVFQWRELCATF